MICGGICKTTSNSQTIKLNFDNHKIVDHFRPSDGGEALDGIGQNYIANYFVAMDVLVLYWAVENHYLHHNPTDYPNNVWLKCAKVQQTIKLLEANMVGSSDKYRSALAFTVTRLALRI